MASKAEKRNFEILWIKAKMAGMEAGNTKNPVPMVVSEHEHPLDDSSTIKNSWFVPGGVCGFAWVKIKPATSAFAKWLKEYEGPHGTYNGYYGGLEYSIHEYGQSLEKKEAHAMAMAKVLSDGGIKAFASSRMD